MILLLKTSQRRHLKNAYAGELLHSSHLVSILVRQGNYLHVMGVVSSQRPHISIASISINRRFNAPKTLLSL